MGVDCSGISLSSMPSNFNNVYTFTDVNFHANKLSITYDPNIHRPHRVTLLNAILSPNVS